jgi:hypothetical protein
MAASYFFASPIDVEVKLEGEELRKKVDQKLEKEKTVSCPVYYDGESVSGQVRSYLYHGYGLVTLGTWYRSWCGYETGRRLRMTGSRSSLSAV